MRGTNKKMEDIKTMLQELKSIMGKDDACSAERRSEIALWMEEHRSPELEEEYRQFLEEGLDEISAEVQDIRRQIADEDYRLLPISYIARKYFGKSHAWLSQRINGTRVRGHVYTLNAEQKQIFNRAMEDLSNFYGSFRLT
jgi:hypothetical protein